MKNIQSIQFHPGTREELLPNYTSDFPYISSRAHIDKYHDRFVPWHWHRAVELFYIESGILEYDTPKNHLIFPEGCGGFVNSNILHTTKPQPGSCHTVQLLHIFDPSFLGGALGSRIEQTYIFPIIHASSLDILPLYPDTPAHKDILSQIRDAFLISEQECGYEIHLREALSHIWLDLYKLALPLLNGEVESLPSNDRMGLLLAYIYDHYAEKIGVSDLAQSAFLSERECYRMFQTILHTPPAEYLKNYRLQIACQLLSGSTESISNIGYACGLGSGSHFGKVFRETLGCTPLQYRLKWQDRDKPWHNTDIHGTSHPLS